METPQRARRAASGRLLLSLLLWLLLLACIHAVAVDAVPRTRARFFLPEQAGSQHEQVLQQLEALGIEQFGAGDASDADRWAQVLQNSKDIDLVWSTEATPRLDQLSLPHEFATKLNYLPGSEQLTSRDLLYQHAVALQTKEGKFFYDFVPAHFELPRDREKLTKAFAEVRKKAEHEVKRQKDAHIYQRFVLSERAANSNEDQANIGAVFVSEEDLKLKLESTEFKDKQVVVDQYVEPFLLDSHKFRVGFYVAVTSVDPLRIYVYDHALIKIAKLDYPSVLDVGADPKTYTVDSEYISPWDFPDLQTDFYEVPSAAREGTNAWWVVKRYMERKGIDTKRLQDEVDAVIAKTVLSNRSKFRAEQAKLKRAAPLGGDEDTPSDLSGNFFSLWKFDFEFDDSAKPWLVGVHSNPSMEPRQSVLGTDAAIKKRVLRDLLNLVGVHPQAQLPFEQFFRPSEAKFCVDKCRDKNRTWDTSCWSCPGWFPPYVARKLFAAATEYARRGRFNLVFPSVELELTKFLDTELTEHDVAFERYVNSLSSGYADMEDFPASDRAVMCVYREHCSGHGDCVNGMCVCDEQYEGRTCYVPKDPEQEEFLHQEQQAAENEAAGAQEAETWKEKVENLVWNRGGAASDAEHGDGQKRTLSEEERFSAAKLMFAMAVLSAFLFGAYRVFLAVAPTAVVDLDHDGKTN